MTVIHARNLGIIPGRARVPAIRELDLEIHARARVAVVGPSGCGKSTLARALVGLEPRMTGSLRIGEVELVGADASRWRRARRELALAWQDPLAALDPRATVSTAIREARSLSGHAPFSDGELDALLERVRFPAPLRGRRPAQLSGGQRQRAALARALASEPRLLIADEVTSAVDRALAIEICRELVALPTSGTALLLITHDLSLLSDAFDEVLVLDRGVVVERGPSARVLTQPEHPLTRALVDAIPRLRRPPAAAGPLAQ